MNKKSDRTSEIDNFRIQDIEEIITPMELINSIPNDINTIQFIEQSRWIIRNIVNLNDPRLAVITWPCSIHNPDEAIEFAKKLQILQKENPHLYIIMRTYFEKPRTTVWWKGLMNDPDLDDSCDINKWLKIARQLLMDINKMWIPTAVEFLDTITPQYIADLVHWWAIWARTTESQEHRKLVSWLSMPVWFKNWTNWDVQVAIDAVNSSKKPHVFLSTTKEWKTAKVTTMWAPNWHIILRWWSYWSNFDRMSINNATEKAQNNWVDTWIIIDASHANSNKDYKNQPKVTKEVALQIASWNKKIVWIMIEANLCEWAQKHTAWKNNPKDLQYWVSITDSCIDLKTHDPLLNELNEATWERMKK